MPRPTRVAVSTSGVFLFHRWLPFIPTRVKLFINSHVPGCLGNQGERRAIASGGVASAQGVKLHFVLPCHVNMRAPSVRFLMIWDSDVMSVIFGPSTTCTFGSFRFFPTRSSAVLALQIATSMHLTVAEHDQIKKWGGHQKREARKWSQRPIQDRISKEP